MAKIKSFYYFFKGKNLYRLRYYEKALAAFEEAIKFNPNDDIYHYKHKALGHINNLNPIAYKKQPPDIKHTELNKQLEEMQGQFQTLQKQVSDLSTNSKLKKVVQAFKDSKNENLKSKISELQEKVKELKSPDFINTNNQFFSDQFIGMQDQFTKLQVQVHSLESNNNITSERVIELQGQVEESDKIVQKNKNQLRKNTEKLEKHYFILQNINAVDKVNIKEHIDYLKSQEPLLYIYYKAFYWTIFNFFHAHLVLSTDLLTHNTDHTITTTESHINNHSTGQF